MGPVQKNQSTSIRAEGLPSCGPAAQHPALSGQVRLDRAGKLRHGLREIAAEYNRRGRRMAYRLLQVMLLLLIQDTDRTRRPTVVIFCSTGSTST
jgi:hypothetical protein